MSIKLGSTSLSSIKLGSTDITTIYLGSTQVFSSSTAPGVPQSLGAVRGDTQVDLSWSAPASDGGSTITGYKVYQSTDDVTFTEVATPSSTSQSITSLTNGTTYYFKIAAVNAVDTGSQTSSVSAVPATTPGVPQSLVPVHGDAQVALSWSAPSSSGGVAVTGYKVYQSTDDSSYSEVATPSGTSQTITSLTNGTQYYFKVAAVNAVGTGSLTSSVNATPATTPTAPQSFTGSAGDTEVSLSWSAPSSNGGSAVTGYKVYQSTDDASYSEVATPSGTSQTVTGLTNGTTYFFKVAAVNAEGTGTQTSSISYTPTAAATAPGVPQSLAATHSNTQVDLTWSAPASDGGATITGYKVYQSTDDVSFSEVATPSGTSQSITSLTNGTTYYFKVAAVNSAGTGTQTSSVNATPATTPGVPQSLAQTAGDTQVDLSWSAPASNGGSAVTGYKVYQSTDDVSFSEVATPSGTSQTITSLTNGTTYYFKVAAVNAEGTGSQTSSVSSTPAAGATAPGVPQSLAASRGNTQVDLSWSAPASDGGATITGYKVYQSTDDVSYSEVATPSGTTQTITSLTNGTTYYFKVAAVNSVDTGTQTSSVSAVPATTPGLPQSLAATRGDTQVALSWSAPSSNGGTAVTGYKVYQSTDDASFTEVATPSGTSHTVTSLTNGTTYYFKVAAVNAVGTGSQTSSESAVPATTPGVPQSLAASHGNAQVDLTWSAPASNGGTAVTGYKVYQSTDNASFSEVATPSGTSQTVTSLTNGTQYYFKVAAVNAVGTGSQTSSVNATPATTPAAPTSLAATNGDTQSVLTWTAPTNTGGSAITGYKVKWGATSGFPGNAAIISTGSTSATYTKTSLTNLTEYSFQVAAINAEGDGTYSSTATATPAAASSGITPNTDSSARFYLPASQTTFRVSAYTSGGYFKISSPGKTDVIGNDHATNYPTYYLQGGAAYAEMTGLSSSAVKTVTVSPCDSSGSVTGNIIGLDVGSDSTNSITSVDISGLTSLTTCNIGAGGGAKSGSKGMGSPIGSRSMASSVTEIRAVNVDFNLGSAYYTPTWDPSITYVYGGGLDLYNQDLDATALNQLYTDLSGGTGGGGIYVGLNTGTGSDNPSIASNYTVYGS